MMWVYMKKLKDTLIRDTPALSCIPEFGVVQSSKQEISIGLEEVFTLLTDARGTYCWNATGNEKKGFKLHLFPLDPWMHDQNAYCKANVMAQKRYRSADNLRLIFGYDPAKRKVCLRCYNAMNRLSEIMKVPFKMDKRSFVDGPGIRSIGTVGEDLIVQFYVWSKVSFYRYKDQAGLYDELVRYDLPIDMVHSLSKTKLKQYTVWADSTWVPPVGKRDDVDVGTRFIGKRACKRLSG
jgi:hypothetical protein